MVEGDAANQPTENVAGACGLHAYFAFECSHADGIRLRVL